jgi:hypothetical protein
MLNSVAWRTKMSCSHPYNECLSKIRTPAECHGQQDTRAVISPVSRHCVVHGARRTAPLKSQVITKLGRLSNKRPSFHGPFGISNRSHTQRLSNYVKLWFSTRLMLALGRDETGPRLANQEANMIVLWTLPQWIRGSPPLASPDM